MLDVTYNSQKIIDALEVTPPVEITYNGSTIATLNAGDTKTLQCNGKVMASDVVIGEKTLQCNGKLMTSDVLIEVVTPMGETWVINRNPNVTNGGLPNAVSITFVSNGQTFNTFSTSYSSGAPLPIPARYVKYDATSAYFYNEFTCEMMWKYNEYKTVTFETAPTGDLLTWLQTNAVKQ